MKPEEIEEARKFLEDPYSRRAFNWGETAAEYALALLSALAAAQEENKVLREKLREKSEIIADLETDDERERVAHYKDERDAYWDLLNGASPEGNEDYYPVLKELKELREKLDALSRTEKEGG